MPQERLPMRKIREVLRLKAGGFSKRRIAASLGVSATAAMECVQRARRAGLTWPLPEELSDDALEQRLYPPPIVKDEQRPLPNWAEIHRELKRPGVTLQLLWQEYREQHPGGYAYSRFCDFHRAWEKRSRQRYARRTSPASACSSTTPARSCRSLIRRPARSSRPSYSSRCLVQAILPTRKRLGTIAPRLDRVAHTRLQILWRRDGDDRGLKSGITKACFYEPNVNRTYQEMADHYDCPGT